MSCEGAGHGYAVYLRGTDGAPPVRLGAGRATALSPDGKFAATVPMGPPPAQGVLLPTGAGLPRPLVRDALHHDWVSWFPDGKHLLFAGNLPGHGTQLFVAELDGSAPRPFTPENMDTLSVVAPDGRRVLGIAVDRKVRLYPLDGSAPSEVPGLEPGDVPLGFTDDGGALYAYRAGELPARIFRVDVKTGHREPWRELRPADRAGLVALSRILITPTGNAYAYRYFRRLSDLYLVEGME